MTAILWLIAPIIMAKDPTPAPVTAPEPDGALDIVIINANIHTFDNRIPRAMAIGIAGNRIKIFGDNDKVSKFAFDRTRIIDAKGKLLIPGFNDAHVHFLDGGFSLVNVNLRDAATTDEFAKRIGDYAKTLPAGKWITGGEWDHEKWPGAPLPTKEMIDSVTPNNPVFISRTDGHMALANSVALKLAGVTKDTKDVPGGFIVRDAKTGEPTGILKDAAMDQVWNVIPKPDMEGKMTAAKRASDYAAKLGVTSVQDMSAGDDVALYQALADHGELKTRIYGMYPLARWEELAGKGVRAHFGTDMVRMGGMKGFADGSLGSSTAYFFEPFSDDPKNRGLLGDQMFPPGTMLARVLGADKAGLQVMIHAIGDEANKDILDIYKQVTFKNGNKDRRFRIEHAQHLRTNEIARFGSSQNGVGQNVIASVQPYHAIDDGRWCEERIGPERSKTTYAFRSLLDNKAVLALGTDWTVAPLDPMMTIYAAVTRRTLDNKHPDGWIPEQKITVEEAVKAYTLGSAYAEFTDKNKGSITRGKLADIVILDQDIFTINPNEIPNTKVALTMVDGKVVYEQK